MLEPLVRHWPLKLLALGLAYVVWFSLAGDTGIVQDFNAPLDIHLPPGRTLSTDPPTTTVVRLRGPETALRRVDPLRLSVRFEIQDEAVGPRDIVLTSANVSGVPREVKIDFIEPDRVALTIDRRVERRLPIVPTFAGEPPKGYAYYGADVRPPELLLVGPASEVEALERLATSPIRLDELTTPSTFLAVAVAQPAHARTVDPRPIDVRVAVYEAPVDQSFAGVEVVVAGAALGATAAPGAVTVNLSGPPPVMERIRASLLRAVADVQGLEPRDAPYLVPLEIDFGRVAGEDLDLVHVKSIRPRQVEVRIGDGRPAG